MINIGKCIGMLRGQKIFLEMCPRVVKAFRTTPKGIVKNAGCDAFSIQNKVYRFVDNNGNITKTISHSNISKSDLLSKAAKKEYSILRSTREVNLSNGTKIEYKFYDRFMSRLEKGRNGSTYHQINLSRDGKNVIYSVEQIQNNYPNIYHSIVKSYNFNKKGFIQTSISSQSRQLMENPTLPPVWCSWNGLVW